MRRHAPEPGRARGHASTTSRSPESRSWSVERRAASGSRRSQLTGRDAEIARDVVSRDQEPPRVPRRGRPRLSHPRPRRADALRRRGAAHPPRGAARLEPAGRLLRARRADHRPAPARQPRSCSTRCRSSATRATRWSSSSTTRTRSGAPSTSSTSARARASAAAGWSRRAASTELAAHADSLTGRFLAHPLVHPLQPRRAGACRRRRAPSARRAPPTRCSRSTARRCTTCATSRSTCRSSAWSRSPA